MTITKPSASDRPRLERIYNICFPGEEEYCRFFFDKVWKPENTLIAKEKGVIAAMGHFLDVPMEFDGSRLEGSYLYAAATMPEYRGKGIMSRIIKEGNEAAAAEGKDISLLITENDSLFDFYSRLSYKPVFGFSKVACSPEPPFMMCRARMLLKSDIPSLAFVYESSAAGRLHDSRSEVRWESILEEYAGRAFGLEAPGGGLMAYCFMNEDCTYAQEVMGAGMGYLLYVCCMDEPKGFGFTLPEEGLSFKPIGCGLGLSANGVKALEGRNPLPYINILYN